MSVETIIERRRAERQALIEIANDYVAQIERRHPVAAAVVFGSVARGDFNLWSDVDLLVVSDAIRGSLFERLDALGDRPPRVQPIAWTVAEWRDQLARGNPIAREAVGAGVWLRGSADLLQAPDARYT
jgi:uncharacterized protein